MLTQARLKELLSYNPETGEFTWLVDRHCVHAGDIAGTTRSNGYVSVRVDAVKYFAHRLAWLYMNGEWPEHLIDHINRNPSDNRFSNLRPATYRQNLRNIGVNSRSTTGVKGVSLFGKSGRYRACIRANGERIWLGLFNSIDEAAAAYDEAAKHHHGEFAHAK